MFADAVVDWCATPAIFYGWVRSTNDSPVLVRALIDGEIEREMEVEQCGMVGPHHNFQWSMDLSEVCKAIDLVDGKLQFVAVVDGETSPPFRAWEKMVRAIEIGRLADTLGTLQEDELIRMFARLETLLPAALQTRFKLVTNILRQSEPVKAELPSDLAQVAVPIGTRTPNGAGIVGRDGELFIVGGSNGLERMYGRAADDPEVLRFTDQWINLFKQRQKALADRGIRFAQLIIPEKSSVLPERFPIPINAPTALLRNLHERLANVPDRHGYIDAFKLLTSVNNSPFQKTDSHLSAIGTFQLFKYILEELGFVCDFNPSFTRATVQQNGDLSSHFVTVQFAEVRFMLEKSQANALGATMTRKVQHIVEKRHIGTHVILQNSAPRIDKKVVVFGNSFFEKGGTEVALTWWFGRWFREFHFLWQPALQMDYVDEHKPDIVICQTIERFLEIVPKA